MLGSKSKNSDLESGASSGTSLISKGTKLTGDIHCEGDIRIDGELKGNIKSSARVIIGADGIVNGDIEGHQADILGKSNGKISVTDLLYIREQAHVSGNIYAGKLQVDPSATFNGNCHMGANVVDMGREEQHAKAK